VVNVQQESDVEGPAFKGNPFLGTMTHARDVRLTMRDVMLLRVDPGLNVVAQGGGQYAARLPVSVGGVPFLFVRGYNLPDVRVGSTLTRLVNTHLESASSDIALAQAHELLAGPAASSLPTVVVCDCNSGPLNHKVKSTDPLMTPQSGPYDFIMGSGFTDEWLQWRPAPEGWTSGLSETADDPTADKFDDRIEMVFALGSSGVGVLFDKGCGRPTTVTSG
jgi:hypothetical protein